MKILTILIFSGDRLAIKDLLSDIVQLNNENINIKVVDWSKNKKILNNKKNIYLYFLKKIKNLSISYKKGGSWQSKYIKFINKFNSKYILIVGDDDRLNINSFKKIIKYLNSNASGITFSFQNFTDKQELKEIKNFSSDTIRPFNIDADLNRIGYISCQIIKTDLINKIFINEKKDLLATQFPQNFIILKIIKEFDNWKVSDLRCIYNHSGNIDLFLKKPETILVRLKSEYTGYFMPLIKNYPYFSENRLNKIYKKIFFKNIISWWFLALKFYGKIATFRNIKKYREIISEPKQIKVILFFFYISPIFLLNFIRIFTKFLRK
jgi:hypothetical protein